MTVRIRRLAFTIGLLWLSAPGGLAPPVSAETRSEPLLSGVDGVEMVVSDLERSKTFFENLGFVAAHPTRPRNTAASPRRGRVEPSRLELTLGSERIALLEYPAAATGRPVPEDTRGNDLWFQHIAIVVSDLERAYAWLRAHRVAHVSSGPQTLPSWNRNAGGIQAFYFADPDGHTLELIQFPEGKGDARWQVKTSCSRIPAELCLFQGIDHTAITVRDTDSSLAFYRDRLGLRVVGESENYGAEQEHLNGVFGARLRITALRAKSGPGVELLEYLAPRGGRAMPGDVRENDLFHWQIAVRSNDLSLLRAAAIQTGGRSVGPAAASGALVRDRDGHALFALPTPPAPPETARRK
jgi:catechol 2,3-dioxygenase-like lactoylglutathione lyase family enzyme